MTQLDPLKLKGNIIDKENIVSTRIRVARNLAGFPLNPASHKDHLLEIERLMRKVFDTLKGDLAGTYYSLATMREEQGRKFVSCSHCQELCK